MTTIIYKLPNGTIKTKEILNELVREFRIQLRKNGCKVLLTESK